MHNFEKLDVYNEAMDFVVKIYEFSKGLPEKEKFILVPQIRRAVTSIPMNIAEGCGCSSNKAFKTFLEYALRSNYEVFTVIKICLRLKYTAHHDVSHLLKDSDKISAMLAGLIKSLER